MTHSHFYKSISRFLLHHRKNLFLVAEIFSFSPELVDPFQISYPGLIKDIGSLKLFSKACKGNIDRQSGKRPK